jgi:two-component system, OmpR family, phosphate regulon sensor histidine kinase PhoR
MCSSIALLLVLQGLWLFSSYEKSFYDLQKDLDGMFRNTVMAIRDSVIWKQIETLPSDSSSHSKRAFVFTRSRDTTLFTSSAHIRVTGNSTSYMNMLVSSTAGADSIKELIQPLIGKFHSGKIKGGDFVIRIGPDSIKRDTLKKYFSRLLASSEIPLPFNVKSVRQFPDDDLPGPPHFRRMERGRIKTTEPSFRMVLKDTLKTEWIQTDPMNKYSAELTGLRLFILKDIAPQILFSVLLTFLTIMAFVVMYKSMRNQERLMEIKNDFISNVTHELKTPVTTVSVALEALRNFKGLENPQRTAEYLDIAQSELNRLTILTDKILKTATFESKGILFEKEPVDLYKTIEQVLQSMKLVLEKQKAQVSFEKKGDSFFIHGGSVHLTNVIYNLLDNALKYSDSEPLISISLDDQESNVILKVTDQGIGIPKEYVKKIFDKFFRVPAGDVHNVKGYGLGLSYVESVVKSHKGKIEVQSEPGKGSTFTIYLPKPAFGV